MEDGVEGITLVDGGGGGGGGVITTVHISNSVLNFVSTRTGPSHSPVRGGRTASTRAIPLGQVDLFDDS